MHQITLALWSNHTKKHTYLHQAVRELLPYVHNIQAAKIYRTLPLWTTAKWHFLNTVISWQTKLSPQELLETCQAIEKKLWRVKTQWDIQRSIDIDIIFYENIQINETDLVIPHPRYHERDFVLYPLLDLYPEWKDPITNITFTTLKQQLSTHTHVSSYHFSMWSCEIVGILNITPDSFSDGRSWNKKELNDRILGLIDAGATIIDIWWESTAPWSTAIDVDLELTRLDTVFSLIKASSYPVRFSLDTMKSKVAEAGIWAGIHIINDVSGWRYDPHMYACIAKHEVPYVLMYCKHPTWRADLEPTEYDNIVQHIIDFFKQRIDLAVQAWIQREQIILDPGMWAFVSMDYQDSLNILRALDKIKNIFELPLFICSSRKWFHGKITKDIWPTDRLWSSLASTWFAIQQGADYVRVHDVHALKQFIDVYSVLDVK